jgi:hypothetical protein
VAELKTAEVPVFDHDVFAGDPVDTAGFPHTEMLSGDTVPVVVEHVDGGSNGKLYSISGIHRRSYVLHLPPESDSEDQEGMWQDQYGNGFSAVSTKGNNLSNPDIIGSITAPSGYIPYGLQEGDSLLRVIRASQVLRHAGVAAEWPIRIAQPKQLPFGAESVEPRKFKSLLLDHVGRQSQEGFNPKELAKVAGVLGGMEFYITYRAMSAAERIDDMFQYDEDHQLPLVAKAISLYNRLAPRSASTFGPLGLPESLSPDDTAGYLGVVLPKLIGHNYGTLHEMGLTHGYPTAGNVNILGAIVDLDSVQGKPLELGDSDNSTQAIADDFGKLAVNIFGQYPTLPDSTASPNLAMTARLNFLRTYLDERKFSEGDPQKRLGLFAAIHRGFEGYQLYGSRERSGLLPQIMPEMEETLETFMDTVAEEVKRTISAKELAKEIYWRQIEGQEGSIWEYAGHAAGLWTNDDYFLQGRLPTAEELEEGLMLYMGADEGEKRVFNTGLIRVCVIPFLQDKGSIRDNMYANRLPVNVLKELACKMLGIAPEPEHMKAVTEETARAMNDGIFEWTAQGFLPDYDEFWVEFKKLFREQHIESTDLSIVPKQDLLTLPQEALEPYEHFWFHDSTGLERSYKNVPKEVVEAYIADNGVDIQEVATSEEVLQTEYVSEDCTRLLISDGSFDDYEEIFPPDETSNEPSYLQFYDTKQREKQQQNHATYAIFLYKRPDGSYRMEYNVLKK